MVGIAGFVVALMVIDGIAGIGFTLTGFVVGGRFVAGGFVVDGVGLVVVGFSVGASAGDGFVGSCVSDSGVFVFSFGGGDNCIGKVASVIPPGGFKL
jgi:hypothetical protein